MSICLEKGALIVVLPSMRQMTHLGEGLPRGPGVGGNYTVNYKINFIQWNFQRFSLDFKSTFHWLLQFYCITRKLHISEYVSEHFLEKLAFLCWETLKILLFHRYFSAIFRYFSKFFQSISTSHFGTIQIHVWFHTPNERCIFSIQWLVVMLTPVVVKWWATSM